MLAEYFGLLAKWNKTINLTALDVEQPSEKAVDRLIIEPTAAAAALLALIGDDPPRTLLDVGSGGGSPAIPLKIALGPACQLHMVESKGRKAAFLRETIRQLKLENAQVHNERLEELHTEPGLYGRVGVLSVRAVRTDQAFWTTSAGFLTADGFLLWFRTAVPSGDQDASYLPTFRLKSVHVLLPNDTSQLVILQKQ
jgi:16S rRNA (guanine527-N7)-methyltransferase